MCAMKFNKIKLYVPAGTAAVAPPFGPILGQYGVNTIQFCNEFNEATMDFDSFFATTPDDQDLGFVLAVEIYIYEDRSYKFVLGKPDTSFLLRLLANVSVGAPVFVVGTLPVKEMVLLAQFKFPALALPSACRMVKGTARSIGIKVIY